MSEAKQQELGEWLEPLILGKANMIISFDVRICLSGSNSKERIYVKNLFPLMESTKVELEAYTHGAAAGALSYKNIPQGPGELVGSFLNRSAGGRLAQVNKKSLNDAKQATVIDKGYFRNISILYSFLNNISTYLLTIFHC